MKENIRFSRNFSEIFNSNGSYSIVEIHKGTADNLTNAVGTKRDAIYRLSVDLYP